MKIVGNIFAKAYESMRVLEINMLTIVCIYQANILSHHGVPLLHLDSWLLDFVNNSLLGLAGLLETLNMKAFSFSLELHQNRSLFYSTLHWKITDLQHSLYVYIRVFGWLVAPAGS